MEGVTTRTSYRPDLQASHFPALYGSNKHIYAGCVRRTAGRTRLHRYAIAHFEMLDLGAHYNLSEPGIAT